MTARHWLTLCALAFAFGLLTGWSARTVTTGDRYIRSLAERHVAESAYFNKKTDQLVRANDPKGEQH